MSPAVTSRPPASITCCSSAGASSPSDTIMPSRQCTVVSPTVVEAGSKTRARRIVSPVVKCVIAVRSRR